MKLIFVRHAETEHNLNGVWQGQLDTNLSAKGLDQAQKLAERLATWTIDALYSSDLSRAYVTAQHIAGYHPKLDIRQCTGLREINLGLWQGLTRLQAQQTYTEVYQRWLQNNLKAHPPQGESTEDLRLRMQTAIKSILSKHTSNENVVIVSHGLAIRTAVADMLSLSPLSTRRFHLDNTGIVKLKCLDDQWVLHTFNDTHHLDA